jgi:membrane AbrB-like protein
VQDRQGFHYALRVGVTLALSAAGGAVAVLLGMPAGWIAGGLLAVAAASLAGVDTTFPPRLYDPVFLLLGIYAGTGVTHDTIHQMQTWPASFVILALSLVAMVAGSYWWLQRRQGWEKNTALLASVPGALSQVVAAAEAVKADLKQVAIAQSIRLLLLVETIPLVALFVGHPDSPALADRPVAGPMELAGFVLAGTLFSLALQWLRVPGGWVLGGLLGSATLILTDLVDARLPLFVSVPATISLVAIAGSRFRPGDLVLLPRIAGAALGSFAIAVSIAVLGASLVTLLFGVNIIQTLLAFAPGALDALAILALQMNIDPAYVAAHHVVRLVALLIAVPIAVRWLTRGNGSAGGTGTRARD